MKSLRKGQTWEINLDGADYVVLLLRVGKSWCTCLDLETGEVDTILAMKFAWAPSRRLA